MVVELNGSSFTLLHEKALYKQEEQLLIIADVHLGKASHFRREGIPIPAHAQLSDYGNLEKLFSKVAPKHVYFLGDLFHSDLNNDWHNFCALIAQFPQIQFTLIEGNHDRISRQLYKEICIDVVDDITDSAFIYTHEPLPEVPDGMMNIAGHIHPGIVLSGGARQSIKLPCFYIDGDQMILPAFGVLTGLYSMSKTRDTSIYAVLPDSVQKI